MVRINCGIPPVCLADQHLNAEYREILLAFGFYRKNDVVKESDNNLMHPICFYKDKLLYLKKRFNEIVEEKNKRGFKSNVTIVDDGFSPERYNDFEPKEIHIKRIKERIIKRLNEKPTWYRYYSEYKSPEFFMGLMNSNKV